MTTDIMQRLPKPKLPKLTRSRWVYILVGVNAVSMIMMYAMQGILVAGIEHNTLPSWFWYADIVGWAVRSVVESLVVLYIFRTKTTNWVYKLILIFFEVVLVVLVMATQGPALYAMTVRLPIAQTMSETALRLWTGGLGAYGMLMLAGASVAWRIQPDDEVVYTQAVCEEMLVNQYNEYEQEKADTAQYLKEEIEKGDKLYAELSQLRDVVQGGDWQTTQGIAEVAGFVSDIKPGAFAKAVNSTVVEIEDALAKGAELRRKGES